MKKYNIYLKIKLHFLLFGLCCFASTSLFGNGFITYLNSAKISMNENQRHYFNVESDNPVHENAQLAAINSDLLKENTLRVKVEGIDYEFIKERVPELNDPNRVLWNGRIMGSNNVVRMVYNRKINLVVAHFNLDGYIYALRPLGEGLYLFVQVNPGNEEGCANTPKHSEYEQPGKKQEIRFDTPDLIKRAKQKGNSRSLLATGECLIRVMVVYTNAADAARMDILSDINNLINIANTGYDNSSVNFNIELAAAFEVNYNEVDLDTSLDDLTFTGGSNSEMDNVHTHRNLWDADQVALITTGGGGLAWLSDSANRGFSVTGLNNFNVFTFHHELGHNAECEHDVGASEPGSAPFAGWLAPDGCFRTIMAYATACPGPGDCTRHNRFSDDNGSWVCGGNIYAPPGSSDARNVDRLNAARGTLVDHRIVENNANYSDDYNWQAREAVHFAASITLEYASTTNKFEFFDGSEGSFRASDRVTLGRGFHARAGTSFRAYLESCSPIPLVGGDEEANE